ncbi:hypothetical protein LO771_00330 [Streptacidiphilus sp. ASG 303]|uniref:hypothetical protein n=1 Tax=Streptacidiphilus sp. ASG 303 TaxID=2896847 RepID=UPI001E393772|nr:hypothetical protein [Streptacidiphilus sp. ASG 303]MCD0480899.1 hypothetical protein [Streptacidiphilus sp. ASG 303]
MDALLWLLIPVIAAVGAAVWAARAQRSRTPGLWRDLEQHRRMSDALARTGTDAPPAPAPAPAAGDPAGAVRTAPPPEATRLRPAGAPGGGAVRAVGVRRLRPGTRRRPVAARDRADSSWP